MCAILDEFLMKHCLLVPFFRDGKECLRICSVSNWRWVRKRCTQKSRLAGVFRLQRVKEFTKISCKIDHLALGSKRFLRSRRMGSRKKRVWSSQWLKLSKIDCFHVKRVKLISILSASIQVGGCLVLPLQDTNTNSD